MVNILLAKIISEVEIINELIEFVKDPNFQSSGQLQKLRYTESLLLSLMFGVLAFFCTKSSLKAKFHILVSSNCRVFSVLNFISLYLRCGG